MSHIENKAIDNLRVLQRKTGKNILNTLVNLYLDTTPSCIANMKTYLQEKAYEDLAREAHSLKSSSGNLGVKPIADWAQKIEYAFIGEEPFREQELKEWIEHIEKLLPEVKDELLAAASAA